MQIINLMRTGLASELVKYRHLLYFLFTHVQSINMNILTFRFLCERHTRMEISNR